MAQLTTLPAYSFIEPVFYWNGWFSQGSRIFDWRNELKWENSWDEMGFMTWPWRNSWFWGLPRQNTKQLLKMVLQWLSNDYIIRLHPQLSNASPMIRYQLIILRSHTLPCGVRPLPRSWLGPRRGLLSLTSSAFQLEKSIEESEDFEETTTSSRSEVEHVENNKLN